MKSLPAREIRSGTPRAVLCALSVRRKRRSFLSAPPRRDRPDESMKIVGRIVSP
ncbi:MAG TPA: hypothetical protein PK207_02565 [Candidatus Aminicenantes bacterium]|nr:hypothetical protein [Candidatus Aminicenantes bacterium]HPL13069.1 hypothetical protein [Candidatus Aminicenantes bacterium]HQF98139.1 hypothetical protein [Candidatus Aminicenantes bacterium]HQH45214.1 hypothetical protein [Candidatus Aminicenantes bacterium]